MSSGLFDYLVVGGGPAGMTAALLLALNNQRVCLIEKASSLGGSLARFKLGSVPYDSGVHFVGGMQTGGALPQMLSVLGLRDSVQAVPLKDNALSFHFERDGATYSLPTGFHALIEMLCTMFPQEACGVDAYMARLRAVCENTPATDLRRLADFTSHQHDNLASLKDVLDKLTGDSRLRALLSGMCMCHGNAPSQVSFATHARVCHDFFLDTCTFEGGGASLIAAFEHSLEAAGVDVRCSRFISQCIPGSDRRIDRFFLSSGEEVLARSVVFAIHPASVLDLLPAGSVSRAFRNRVCSFEPSVGFFTVFGSDATAPPSDSRKELISLLPDDDFDVMLEPGRRPNGPLVVLSGSEQTSLGPIQAYTMLELSFPSDVEPWQNSSIGCRPPAYQAYKEARTGAILDRIRAFDAEKLGPHFEVRDTASMLTYRDYLHSPNGSAYGIKQLPGQANLFGRLPLRNAYATGQCAMLPGLAGAMMSSFILMRLILGRDVFLPFLDRRCSR